MNQLYKQLILDHNKSPKNYGELPDATHSAEGFNPLCGDHYWVELIKEGDKIQEIKFHGEGCAISKASASVMTKSVKEKSAEEALAIMEEFSKMIKGESERSISPSLDVFKGVRDFPTRTKCASLPWHTLKNALEGKKLAQTE